MDSIVADDVGSFPDRGEKAVVVTGTRAQESARMRARPDKPAAKAVDAARRGDWNACTIEDPARSLQACRATIDPAAPGDRGRADARIADGLDRAWAGDMRGAVAAFDRAIDLTERSPSAYLNRGLARERSGDRRGALSDLDKAVRLSPESARGYYLRSLVRDRNGDRSGARADAERAIALDPAYEAVVRY